MSKNHLPGDLAAALFRSLVLVAGLAAFGCGGNPNSARIAGTVTVDGEPVAKGYLLFLPQPTGSAPPVGAEVADGSYSAEVPIGKLLVMINATRPTGKMIREYSEPREEFVSIVPAKYAQGIAIEVRGPDRALNFDMKSK